LFDFTTGGRILGANLDNDPMDEVIMMSAQRISLYKYNGENGWVPISSFSGSGEYSSMAVGAGLK